MSTLELMAGRAGGVVLRRRAPRAHPVVGPTSLQPWHDGRKTYIACSAEEVALQLSDELQATLRLETPSDGVSTAVPAWL